MPTFTLNTTFDQSALSMLYATGSNVVVAKPSSSGGTPNVAWVVYRPMPDNVMTWEEQYGIYASTSSIQNGAKLKQMSATPFPAGAGKVYTLQSDSNFSSPQSGGTANSYTAINQYDNLAPNGPGWLTFGLFQNATVNQSALSGNAVSAAGVPFQSTAVMTPYTTVYIWTQSQVVSNTVVTLVTSTMTSVKFGGSVTEISLQYDQTTGGFVNVGGALKMDARSNLLVASGGEELPSEASLAYHIPLLG
ncbi:MAG TPA: hypothetical protein VEL74_20540 [Thermoanaerobaculia bacterium]|nr:hypothetical protein [Thermoanaerobaculia bacterium]